MAKKRHTAERIISKLREAEVLLANGTKMPQVCRRLGVHGADVLPHRCPILSGRKGWGTELLSKGILRWECHRAHHPCCARKGHGASDAVAQTRCLNWDSAVWSMSLPLR